MTVFPTVTLLITHYNRTVSLERLLKIFKTYEFGEIIVSDDGSLPENIEVLHNLKSQYNFTLLTVPKNKGLGHNINKGQNAVKTPYTLYIQEDFIPCNDYDVHLSNAIGILENKPEIDMVRFYAYFKYPYLKPFKNGFSEMIFKIWYPGYRKFYMYSDHPHLRRSNFLEKFGQYTEGVKGDVTEYNMMMSFIKNKGRAMFHEDYRNIFQQENSSEEPSTMKRNYWRETKNPIVSSLRHIYRHVKLNFDYLK